MNTWQKALICYLAASGGYGLYEVAVYCAQLGPSPLATHPVAWLVLGGFLALYAALGLSALGLWRTHRYSWGTLALQIMQLVGFCLGGYKYEFAAGSSLQVLYEDNRLELHLTPITSVFMAGLNSHQEFLYINLLPLLIIYLLQKHFLSRHVADAMATAV